jgi:hypothetical protein
MNSETRPPIFDFGEFSPRCLGVTVNLPEELGEHMYSMAAFLLADDPEERRHEFVKTFVQDSEDPAAQFIGISYGSVVSHELKHFHDYLASPFGCSVMREHFLLLLQGFVTIPRLLAEPVIGIPLQSWRDLSDSLHQVYTKQSGCRGFKRFPPESTRKTTEYVEVVLRTIQAWHSNPPSAPGFPISTRHLIEAAAIEVQLAVISKSFGPEWAVFFGDHLAKLDKAGTYSTVAGIWRTVAEKFRTSIPAAVRNAVLFYALCGKPAAGPDDLDAHPASRFVTIMGHMRERNGIPGRDEVLAFLDSCAGKHHWPTLTEALEESRHANRQYALVARQMARSQGGGDEDRFPHLLFDAYDGWVSAHDEMISRIVKDPLAYLDPVQYLDAAEHWVAAPKYVSTTSTEFFREGARLYTALIERGWKPVWGVGSAEEGSCALFYSPDFTVGLPVITREHAFVLSLYIWDGYALWSRGMLNPASRWVVTQTLARMKTSGDMSAEDFQNAPRQRIILEL